MKFQITEQVYQDVIRRTRLVVWCCCFNLSTHSYRHHLNAVQVITSFFEANYYRFALHTSQHLPEENIITELQKTFSLELISWLNVTNRTHFNPSVEERLFGVTSELFGKKGNEEI